MICSIDGCLKTKHAKGYCSKHYSQFVRSGKIETSWHHTNRRNRLITYSKNDAYKTWQHMKDRCYDTEHPSYKYYGARGIKVCERWINSFDNFRADMGDRPAKRYTLDRIDSNGNYEPSNCRWATFNQQAMNRSNNSAHPGVRQFRGRWIASLMVSGVFVLHSYFGTFEEALEARKNAEKSYLDNVTML